MTGLLKSIFPRLVPNSRIFAMSSSTKTIVVGDLEVLHDPDKSRFFIVLDDTSEAVLEYDKKENIIDLFHTEVPMGYQGKGIAGVLAKAAFNHAVENNMKMKLSCTYLQNYYKDNKKEEYSKLVITLE